MTEKRINTDLTKMPYEHFQTFMQGIALLYSNVSFERNYMSLFSDLSSMAKHVERLPSDFFTFYGAYEIAGNQVVLAVFRINLSESESDESPNISDIEVSFAEDERNLRCSVRIRKYLTQSDFVARANVAYPPVMEDLLWEKDSVSKKTSKKTSSTEMENPVWDFDDDVSF